MNKEYLSEISDWQSAAKEEVEAVRAVNEMLDKEDFDSETKFIIRERILQRIKTRLVQDA